MNRMVAWKKAAACLALVVLAAALLSGCKLFSRPEADIQSYAEAVGHLNEAAANEFGLDVAKLREESETPAKEAFAALLPGSIDMAKLDETTDALYDKMKTLHIQTELVSKDGDTATVKVTTDYIDYIGILPGVMQAFQTDLEADMESVRAMPQEEGIRYLMGQMLTKIADGVRNAEIKGQNSFETAAKYDDKLGKWVPEKEQTFQQTLYRKMLMGEDKESQNN